MAYLTLSHISKAGSSQFESQSNSKDGAEEKAHCKEHRKNEADQRESRPSHLGRNSPVLPVEDEISRHTTPKPRFQPRFSIRLRIAAEHRFAATRDAIAMKK
jgi:hypothetical protein